MKTLILIAAIFALIPNAFADNYNVEVGFRFSPGTHGFAAYRAGGGPIIGHAAQFQKLKAWTKCGAIDEAAKLLGTQFKSKNVEAVTCYPNERPKPEELNDSKAFETRYRAEEKACEANPTDLTIVSVFLNRGPGSQLGGSSICYLGDLDSYNDKCVPCSDKK